MKVSAAGRELITRNEGLELEAYPDPATGGDPWSIGYGDTGPDVVPGLRITKEEAIRRLDDRLAREFGAAVNKAIGSTPTTQGQFDAMVSLAYNIGVGRPGGKGGFVNSSICRHHVAQEYEEAADAFLFYNKAAGRVLAGLTRRRKEERALYLSTVDPVPIVEMDDVVWDYYAATRSLQTFLHERGFYRGQVDGDFGGASRLALSLYLESK